MQKYYAMKAKEDALRMRSSSGGVFYSLGSQILAQGGTVYGACYDENWQVVHRRASTPEQLRQLSGSKYTRSNWKDCLPQIKEDLLSGTPVLFSGTPCQAAAVRKLAPLGNLYLVDIVCHGTPKPYYLAEYLKMMENRFGAPVSMLNMRSKPQKRFEYRKKHPKEKRYRLVPHTMQIDFENGRTYCSESEYDPYFLLMDYLLNESCYHCAYRSLDRVTDISLGDFHEFSSSLGKFNDGNGVSLVLVNTEKGNALLNTVMDAYEWQEKKKEEIIQPPLVKLEKPADTDAVRKQIAEHGFAEAANRIAFRNPRLQLRRFCDRLGILDIYLSMKSR